MIKKRVVARRRLHPSLDTARLRQKRRRRKMYRNVALSLTMLLICAGFIFTLRLPFFQVKEIKIEGANNVITESMRVHITEKFISKAHIFGLIFPTSTFFIDEDEIYEDIMKTYPNLYDIKVDNGIFGTLHISVHERGMYGVWCKKDVSNGNIDQSELIEFLEHDDSTTNIDTNTNTFATNTQTIDMLISDVSTTTSCFDFDYQGYIFAPHLTSDVISATQNDLQNMPIYKGGIEGDPISQNYLNHENLELIAQISQFMTQYHHKVSEIDCNKQNDCILKIDTHSRSTSELRINISEQQKKDLLERLKVVFEQSQLKSSSFEYIDMRFGKKVFYKIDSDSEPRETLQNNASTTKNHE